MLEVIRLKSVNKAVFIMPGTCAICAWLRSLFTPYVLFSGGDIPKVVALC